VAILVDSDVYNDANGYDGLNNEYGSYLGDDTLAERIDRYGYDVQAELAMTKSLIIQVNSGKTPEEISAVLEKLYFDGDDIEGEENHLVGIVVVGDVALPVVTKDGNKFLSMLPYTDFEDKVYIFNEQTGNFERNASAVELEPEIWHGVIVPPSDDSNEAGNQLAEYFDKNHLYHLGVTEYSEFDQKLFYGDMVAEEKAISKESFAAYDRFTDNWETVAYNRYNKHLAEDLYIEAVGTVSAGDNLDNDEDGLVDEDPEDGIDNDGDDLVDEDPGDPFDEIDNDQDGSIDEDGIADNDNDGDGKIDEDTVGDLNSDGCPGACNVDDDNDGRDTDDDGWPTGVELMAGWDPEKKSSPFLFKLRDEDLQEEWGALFMDEDPYVCPEGDVCWTEIDRDNNEGTLQTSMIEIDDRCYDAEVIYHPEWDDDEDGYCDEDTDTDNDGDGDGTQDEDMGESDDDDTSAFDDLPDIQTKTFFEQLTKRYYELFEKVVAETGEFVDYTGRYWSSYTDSDGSTSSDLDSPMSLIGKKDEFTITYLRAVNDLAETQVDSFVENVQRDISFIANVNIQLEFNFEDGPSVLGDPIYFVNHSVTSSFGIPNPFDIVILGQPVLEVTKVQQCSEYMGTYDDEEGGAQLVEGLRVYDYNTAGEYEEEGEPYGGCYGSYANMEVYGDDIADLTFCFPEIASESVKSNVGTKEITAENGGDESLTPDYRACNNFRELKGFLGDTFITSFFTDDSWGETFLHLFEEDKKGYIYYAEEFTKEVSKLFDEDDTDDQDGDGDYDEEDFAMQVRDIIDELGDDDGAYDIPYPSLYDIPVYDYDYMIDELEDDYDEDEMPEIDRYMDLADVFEMIGYDPDSQDDLNAFLTGDTGGYTLEVDDDYIESIDVYVNKYYVKDEEDPSFYETISVFEDAFTTDESEAYSISSVFEHKAPTSATITAQVDTQFSEALPIDDPRFVSFQDQNEEYAEIYYPNVFDAENAADFYYMLQDTDSVIAEMEGGDAYETLLEDYFVDYMDEAMIEDALAWMHMNIDEKHEYVMSHYLGEDDAFISDPDNGYEVAYIVGSGNQLGYDFGFNGEAKVDDPDTELNNPDLNYNPDALPKQEDPVDSDEAEEDSFEAVDLLTWLEMILVWIDSLSTVGSSMPVSVGCAGGAESACVGDSTDSSRAYDSDDDGIADSAAVSDYIKISADNSKMLYADGVSGIEVTVELKDQYGALNTEDNFTQVELYLIEGDEYGQITSENPATVYQGRASFTLTTTQKAGEMMLQAQALNNDYVNNSDYTYLTSTSRRVKVYTYDVETVTTEKIYTSTELEDLVLLNGAGEVAVTVDAETGAIEFSDESVTTEILPAKADLPTRISFNDYGVLYVVPKVEEIVIQEGERSLSEFTGNQNVEAMDTNDSDNYYFQFKQGSTDEVWVWENEDRPVAAIKSNGQVFVREDLDVSLSLKDPNFASVMDINVAEIKVGEVRIGVNFEEPSVEIIEPENSKDYLSLFDIKTASAESSLPDTDSDGLNDLFEYTIGTNLILPDTDSDGYGDWEEVENGYDPLNSSGAPLFSDMNAEHLAYANVLELYLRGVIGGYEDGTFKPDKAITREEFTKLNLGGLCIYCNDFAEAVQAEVAGEYNSDPFPDTNISDGLYYCVAESKNEELISGYKSGDFEGYYLPSNYISRAEAAKVILEAAEKLSDSNAYSSSDYAGTDKPWYYNYVLKAQELGLFPTDKFIEVDHYSGDMFKDWFDDQISSGGTFVNWLTGNITRAEFAMMIVHLIEINDCRLNDADFDFLSDNEEGYSYGTDPNEWDTDKGGVSDFAEVVYGTDPLDSSDDYLNEYEFTEPVDIGFIDFDGDFISDNGENNYGLNPYDPDTDDGGVIDGLELLYGTDPLDTSDDNWISELESGVYAVGENWQRDFVYSSEDYVETIISENIVYLSKLPADGYSTLYLRAEVLDEDGEIDIEDDSSVVTFIISDGADYAEIDRQNVAVKDGIAETSVIAKTNSGIVQVTAEITSGYPAETTEVDVYPGEPIHLEFMTESTVMSAGGVNKMDGILMLYDQYGNIAYGEPYIVTLDISGGSTLTDVMDEDDTLSGIQITTYEGYATFAIISSEDAGTTTLTANLGNYGNNLDISVLEGIYLEVDSVNSVLTADGYSETAFDVYAKDSAGNILAGFNPNVVLNVLDDTFGSLISASEIQLSDGTGTGTFLASTVAGDAYVMASSLGTDPGSALITLEPGPVHELRLDTSDGNVEIMTEEDKEIVLKAYDQYGNFAYNDSATEVEVRLTEASQEYGSLSDDMIYTSEGTATFTATAGNVSGFMNVVASANNLMSGTLNLSVRSDLTSEEMQDIDPNVLYANLLGASVGQVTYEDYFGGWFLFNGKTEAVISLLDEPEPHKRLMQLDSTGKSTLIEGNFLVEDVIPGGSEDLPMKIIWQDNPANLTLAEILIILDEANGVYESTDLTQVADPGAYIAVNSEDYSIKKKFSKLNNSLSLLYDDNEILRLSANGQIKLFSANYDLSVNTNYDYPAIAVTVGGVEIATVLLVPNSFDDVHLLDMDFDLSGYKSLDPGVYIKQYESTEYGFELSFSGNSSMDPKGCFLVDNLSTLPSSQAPSLGYTSLDKAQNEGGIGFDGDNKNILLFSGGNTAGESNKYAVSEIGVLLGDPTISIHDQNDVNTLGYTKDIGRMLLSSSDTIKDMVPLDYNNDGLQDLLIAYETGEIKLLQNYDSEERFKDRGTLLNIVTGILSFDHADFDLDGYEDLVVTTEDACIEGEVCVYVYKNNEGQFIRENLDLDTGDQVYQILAEDMNNDDYADLITSDNVGTIKVFYNKNGKIDGEGDYLGNLGIKVDDEANLAEEVFVYYEGMTIEDDATTYDLPIDAASGFSSFDEKFGDNNLDGYFADILGTDIGSLEIDSGDAQVMEEVAFVQAQSASKYGVDVNGGIVEPGDEIEYTITLTNSSTAQIDDLYLADTVSGLIDPDLESFDGMEIIETGATDKPFVIRGITLPAGDSIDISYSAYVLSVPQVNISTGNDFDDYVDDDYPDVVASPVGNPTGQVVYFYSNGSYIESDGRVLSLLTGTRKINYTETTSDAVDTEEVSKNLIEEVLANAGLPNIDFDTDNNDNGTPDDLETEEEDELPAFLDSIMSQRNNDADSDGLIDDWDLVPNVDDISQMAIESEESEDDGVPDAEALSLDVDVELVSDEVAGAVEEVLSSFICGGGCIASPLNVAFLSMGAFNFFGVPTGYFPGFPIFGVMSPPPFVCIGFVCDAPTSFLRIYLDITTTLGIATAFCVGPYPTGMCWAFNLPILQATGICDTINSAISAALSAAGAMITEGASTIFSSDSGSSSGGGGNSGGFNNYNLGSYEVSSSFDSNIQVPGFPSIFTEWWKRQKFEITQMLDLPDIYLILPDLSSIASSFVPSTSWSGLKSTDLNGLSKVLTLVNSLPIVNIKVTPVTLVVPSLSQEEFLKYKEEAELWLKNVKAQWDEIREDWVENGFNLEVQGIDELIANVEANIQTIDEYLELPMKIIEYRQAIVLLVEQIVCWIDAIVSYFGGYVFLNMERVEAWGQFVKDVIDAFKSWKALFQVAIDYQDSCGSCKTQRGSLMELLMKLFVFIPDIPIIDLPKLPDIVLDISQIQAGVEFTIPELDFKAEPMILPDIPSLDLPGLPTIGVALEIPSIPLLPNPPDLPDLPELPSLSLPDLPDIPPPPEVPSLDAEIEVALKVIGNIIRIVCLVWQGLMPTPENQLKTKMEDLTQRPLDVVFPFDVSASFSSSSISFDFVQRIEIIARMNLSAETTFIVDAVQQVADVWNVLPTAFVSGFNEVSSGVTDVLQEGSDAVTDAAETVTEIDVDVDLGSYEDQILIEQGVLFVQALENLNEKVAEYNDAMSGDISLVAGQHTVAPEELPSYDEVAYKDYGQYEDLLAGTASSSLIQLKDQLVAYVENSEELNDEIEGSGWDGLGRLIVQDSPYLLADYTNDGEWTNAGDFVESLEETADLTGEDLSDIEENMTDTVNELFADTTEDDTSDSSYNALTPITKGLFIYNEEEEVSERLISYTGEASADSSIVMFDMDNDGDDDIVYSYGGSVYLKENYSDDPSDLDNYSGVPRLASLDYFMPNEVSINLFASNDIGNEEANMTFSSETDSVGYEVRYYESPSSFDFDDPPLGIISVLNSPENESLTLSDSTGNSYTGGTEITGDSELILASSYEDLIMIPANAPFILSEISKGFAYVSESNGGLILNSYLRIPVYKNGETTVTNGDIIHTLQDSEITIDLSPLGGSEMSLILKENTVFVVPTNFTFDFDFRVENGGVEIIDTSEENRQVEQPLAEGMLLFEGDIADSDSGSATVALLYGGTVSIANGQVYYYKELSDPANPTLDITLDNGNYYAKVWSVSAEGEYSTSSNAVLLAPQICADESTPYIDVGPLTKDLAIFSTMTLSAEGSFDTESDIVAYYWDGVAGEATFEVGPYDEVGEQYVELQAIDEAGNTAIQTITINVYVPDIYISTVSTVNNEVTGYTDPAAGDMPFILIRDRDGIIEQVITDTADENGKYYTDSDGNYKIEGLDLDDIILILNSDGEVIAEFDPSTLQLLSTDERYGVDVLPTDLEWPTRLIVYEIATGEILQSILLVTDSNVDVTVQESDFEFTAETILGLNGVHMKVLNDFEFEINKIGASDPLFPGGIEVIKDGERAALATSDGNIYLLNDNFDLSLKDADYLSEPLMINLDYEGDVMAEIFISPSSDSVYEETTQNLGLPLMSEGSSDMAQEDSDGGGVSDEIELIYGLDPLDNFDDAEDSDGDSLSNIQEATLGTDLFDSDSDDDGISDYTEFINDMDPLSPVVEPFEDISIDDPLFIDIYDMVEKGILSGYDVDGLTYFMPDQEINRAEFTKIILAILCITPSDEASLAPSVFNDISYESGAWYYDETKESYLRDFITGYLGELDSNGMAPFKPGASITRAEAAKIILEALDKEGFINLGDIAVGEPWYEPYMQIAQDLTPYLISPAGDESFILTAEEAADPTHEITRYEFVEMSVRALQAYNCYEVDYDGDGLSDWEENNIYASDPTDSDTDDGGVYDGEEASLGTDPLDYTDDDWDGDTLNNNDETDLYGTDPNDADTDDGGIPDGVEVNRGSDPLDPSDDYISGSLLLELDPGIYFVTDECLYCPCPSSIENGQDAMAGDIIYTAITNTDNTEVYAISNEYSLSE